METKAEIRAAAEAARGKKRSALWGGIFSALFLLVVIIFGIIREKFAGSYVFASASIAYAVALLFSIAAYLDGAFAEMAAEEEEEKQLLAERKDSSILEAGEDVRFTSGSALKNYRRFAPFVFTVLGAVLIASLLWYFKNSISSRQAEDILRPDNAMHATLLSVMMLFGSVFAGAFFLGQSRTPAYRLLRPVGGYLIAGFVVMVLAVLTDLGFYNQKNFDSLAFTISFWMFAVLGAELILGMIIEFYRPRSAEEPRPLYESRLLSLFTEPGGVMRNLSDALDYQFGFKLSKTWLYSFTEQSILPLLVIFLAVFWLSTSLYEVQPGEQGVRECFGRVTSEPLPSGVYLALPRPFGQIRTVNCDTIRNFTIGVKHDDSGKDDRISSVVLWTESHLKNETNYVVAAEPTSREKSNDTAAKLSEQLAHPISFVGFSVPIQYRVKDIMAYLYHSERPDETLRNFAEQVMIEYLAGTTLDKLLNEERMTTEHNIHERLQRLADAGNLGVEIIAVNLLDLHPPVGDVSKAYQEVIGAIEKKETMILEAQTYAAKVVPEAKSTAQAILSEAESHRYSVTQVAAAEKELFERQLTGFSRSPEIYRLNAYLRVWEKEAMPIRKYLISSKLKNEIYELNFEEKERLDLIDADLSTLVEKK